MRIEDVMKSTNPDETDQEPGETLPGTEQATPEEQQAYEKVVLAGMSVLYDDKTRDKVLTAIKSGGDDPAKALAKMAQMIITQLDEKSKGTIPETVLLPAAAEILEHTAELAQVAGIAQVDDATLGQAGQHLVWALGEQYGVDEEELMALVESLKPEQIRSMVEQQSKYAPQEPQQPQEAASNGPA